MTPPDEVFQRSPKDVPHDAPGRPAPAVRYRLVRDTTEALAAPLSAEDQNVQSMPDASPAKWHRAHTTWFFETFVLRRFDPAYRVFDPAFNYLFNSYYEAVGARQPRPERGAITRPSASDVGEYRRHVDAAMQQFLASSALAREPEIAALVELGLNHEQQHQELLLTDILHAFAQNPLHPAYSGFAPAVVREAVPLEFIGFDGGLVEIGHAGRGFAFDNEGPRHRVFLEPYRLANRPITNGEWLEFMEAGGYSDPAHWLSDGWQTVQREGWRAPLYWREIDGEWQQMALFGYQPLDPNAPVVHVSFYEADAFARWKGARLPTEAEWEHAAEHLEIAGNLGGQYYRPLAAPARTGLQQMFGDVWEWTSSAYAPYPGFAPATGAVGEYNGKFMCNQLVLKGGSCVTPAGHIRASYRNFFYPHQRWQFMGVRLAKDAAARKPRAEPVDRAFLHDVWSGLSAPQKTLPCKYFYDREGSRLFDAICELPEYYLTRTETELLREAAHTIAELTPEGAALVEFGSGSSVKTRIVLDAMTSLVAYVPVDISAEHLSHVAADLAVDYPNVDVLPVAADFTERFAVPEQVRDLPLVGFFPGSTIGNFTRTEAESLLRMARRTLGEHGMLIIGIDLVKDADTLIAAYDDSAGVTERFNKNVLARINRAFGADFDLSSFSHRAIWNARDERIEMNLVSEREQTVTIAGHRFAFKAGETIHTENSHKYRLDQFVSQAAESGWTLRRAWTNEAPGFAILLLG